MTRDWETLLPLLVHIQAHLEEDLGLEALSRKAGLSPFYLQRLFKAAIGETPKAYTSRLRLERGAFRLLVHDSNVLDIALECGFQSHESFLRAFRRRFGRLPSDYREWVRGQLTAREESSPEDCSEAAPAFEISKTRVIPLRPAHLAFRRHVGPYESVPESLFEELEEWAARRGLPGPPVWMGIGHDAPGTTPAEQLRFDAALVVPGPFAPEGRIAYQLLPGGPFAVTTHVGPYDTLPAAYAAIFPRLLALPGYQLVGLPAVEIYHTTRVNVRYRLNHTDLCLPVSPRRA
ncbi:MAG TPA: AraC family transcriptional regulator [Thermoanaerobaculia bacterium]|nr:AraC family transcriptional regulator [Thermoanaerobaculia bacterium]